MTIEIKVPTLPESVADATIAQWYKKPGDTVKRDENLVDLETDKVMLEVPAPHDGVLESIEMNEGETVTADTVIGKLKEGAVAEAAPETKEEAKPAEQKPAEKQTEEKPAQTSSAATPTTAPDLSPSVRRAVAEHDVDVSSVKGTGRGGRLVKQDVLAAMGARAEKRVPMSRLRARVAERLLQVGQETAMLTTFNEVDMKPVMDIRAKYKDQFLKSFDVKLGFMSFFVKAAVEALKKFPAVNASIDGTDIVYHGYYDIGIAVSTERGLVVPVIRNADQLSMAEIEQSILDYAQKARDNKLKIEEMTGGTFTITNGGVFGSMLSTPIINPPQSAILGMHNIVKRAVVVNDEVVVRPMMYLAMSYDHRIVDGRESVTFLKTIKEGLEDPARMLIGL